VGVVRALAERDPERWAGLKDALIAAALDSADDGTNRAAEFCPSLRRPLHLPAFSGLRHWRHLPA